uniref:Mitochondrial assembly of ribosomal large subunit protein 1 n=1 Tax=Leptobrachium leishanense TaxID=445787 RepID=A0A8C5M701_9ANUR
MWARSVRRVYHACRAGYRADRTVSPAGRVQCLVSRCGGAAELRAQVGFGSLHALPGCDTAEVTGRSSQTPDTGSSTDMLTPAPSQAEAESQDTVKDGEFHGFNLDVLVSLLRQENGRDVCVIQVPPEVKYVEYFVIVSGFSTRHIQAMAQYTLKTFKSLKKVKKTSQIIIEGKDTEDWMCIDFGNIVVHFMLPETRELYELEKLWTLRSHDDQLCQIAPEILPADFTFGLESQNE